MAIASSELGYPKCSLIALSDDGAHCCLPIVDFKHNLNYLNRPFSFGDQMKLSSLSMQYLSFFPEKHSRLFTWKLYHWSCWKFLLQSFATTEGASASCCYEGSLLLKYRLFRAQMCQASLLLCIRCRPWLCASHCLDFRYSTMTGQFIQNK